MQSHSTAPFLPMDSAIVLKLTCNKMVNSLLYNYSLMRNQVFVRRIQSYIIIERSLTQPLQMNASCRRRELYILQESWSFSLSFQHCSLPYVFIFNTSIALVGAHERIAKYHLSKYSLLRFLQDLEYRTKFNLGCLCFFSVSSFPSNFSSSDF